MATEEVCDLSSTGEVLVMDFYLPFLFFLVFFFFFFSFEKQKRADGYHVEYQPADPKLDQAVER